MTVSTSPSVPSSPAGTLPNSARSSWIRCGAAAQSRRCGASTEAVFVDWIRRFVLFHGKRHPAQMAEPEVSRFLTHLAVEEHVSPSTQSQARAAIVFLYRHVLDRPLGHLDGVVRAKRVEPAQPSTSPRRAAAGECLPTFKPPRRG